MAEAQIFFHQGGYSGYRPAERGCYTSEGTSTCIQLEATTILANREIIGTHEFVSEFPFR